MVMCCLFCFVWIYWFWGGGCVVLLGVGGGWHALGCGVCGLGFGVVDVDLCLGWGMLTCVWGGGCWLAGGRGGCGVGFGGVEVDWWGGLGMLCCV